MKFQGMSNIDILLGAEPKKIVIEESAKQEEPIVPLVENTSGATINEVVIDYLKEGYTPETVTTVIFDYAKQKGIRLGLDEIEKIAELAGEFGYDSDAFEDLMHYKM